MKLTIRIKHIFCIFLISLGSITGVVSSCSLPSSYTPTNSDTELIQSVQVKISEIFEQDSTKIQNLQEKISLIADSFDISSQEYYILRELHQYMNSLMSSMTHTPAYDSGQDLTPYMLYSPELIDIAKERGFTIVLNFRASWCPRCKTTSEDIILHQVRIPEDVIVLEADFDTTKDLQSMYGVTMQTTFVFLDNTGIFLKKVEKLSGIDQLIGELSMLSN